MEKKIHTADLELGMYVSRPDRPWEELPFLFQGWFVQSEDEIHTLREYCTHVYIDVQRGRDVDPAKAGPVGGAATTVKAEKKVIWGPNRYQDTTPVERELIVAHDVYAAARQQLGAIAEAIRAGQKPDLTELNQTADAIVESVLRNPDAFTWLTHLKTKDTYTYCHALNTCIFAVALGRHLGLAHGDLQHLALGAMLCDVGKLMVRDELLSKAPPCSTAEWEELKGHVTHGVTLLEQVSGISPQVLQIVQYHHERHDGSGYLQGLAGEAIPFAARIAAIADTYDALTSEVPYRRAVTHHQAITELYNARDVGFQGELVEQFIQCLGVYPVGTLVELTNAETAVVVGQRRDRRLRPKVMVVGEVNGGLYQDFKTVDLSETETDPNGKKLEIVRALEPTTWGIDPAELYLNL